MVPTLLIGLGGTGTRVLTCLKNRLIQRHQGVVPPTVHLLAFDVEAEPPLLDWTQVRLSTGQEFHTLRSDLLALVRAVAAGRHPQVAGWLPAHQLSAVPTGFHYVGGPRPLGRLSLFDDLRSPPMSKVIHALTHSIELLRHMAPPEGLQIYLISSTFGATGSACIADFAHLARQIAWHNGLAVAVHGFLVTPETFGALIGGEHSRRRSQARNFATLREINRFQTTADAEVGYPMYYDEEGEHPILHGRLHTRPFDSITLVDGRAPKHPLSGTGPDFGVFPAISEHLLSLLCDGIGPPVTPVVWAPGATTACRAFGCISLVLPMEQIADGLACRLALETLDALLAPREWDRQGIPVRLAPDHNREAGLGCRGRDAVKGFLAASRIALMGEIMRLAEQFEADPRCYSRPSDFIPRYPRQRSEADLQAELATRDRREWQRAFCPGPQLLPDETVQILHTQVRDRCGTDLYLQGCSIRLLLKRRQVQAELESWARTVDVCITDFFGEYRRALEACTALVIHHFVQMLRTQTLIVLNGQSDEASEAKGGKLGYLCDFFDSLREAMGRARSRLLPPGEGQIDATEMQNRVRTHFQNLGDRLGQMVAAPGCWLLLSAGSSPWQLTRAFRAELDLGDKLADEVCSLMVRQAEANTISRLIAEVDRFRALSEGRTCFLEKEMYGGLLERVRQGERLLSQEGQIGTWQVIQPEAFQAEWHDQRARHMRDAVADLLGDFEWELSMTGEQPVLRLTLSGQVMEEGSLGVLADRCRDAFAETYSQTSLLDHLMQSHPNPKQWVDWLLAQSAPQLALLQESGDAVQTAHIQIGPPQNAAQATYLNQAMSCLSTGLNGNLVHLTASDEPFVCTLTRALDGIPLEQTATYQESLRGYQAHTPRPSAGQGMLHVFPAEVNAAHKERRLPELGQVARLLDDRVTVLLEDMELIRLFGRCLAFGVIRRQDGVPDSHYSVFLPDVAGALADVIELNLTEPNPGDPDIVEAIKTFAYRGQSIGPGETRSIDHREVYHALEEAQSHRVDEILLTSGAELQGYEESQRLIVAEQLRKLPNRNREEAMRLLARHAHLRQSQTELRKQLEEASDMSVRDAFAVIWLTTADEIGSLEAVINDVLKKRNTI